MIKPAFVKDNRNLSRGAALVEFAIVFPFFILFVLVSINLSMVIIKYKQVNYSAETMLKKYAATREAITASTVVSPQQMFQNELKVFGITMQDSDTSGLDEKCTFGEEEEADPDNNCYYRFSVSMDLNCHVCSVMFGFGDSLKRIEKFYYQLS